jgi:hypothetical protein
MRVANSNEICGELYQNNKIRKYFLLYGEISGNTLKKVVD